MRPWKRCRRSCSTRSCNGQVIRAISRLQRWNAGLRRKVVTTNSWMHSKKQRAVKTGTTTVTTSWWSTASFLRLRTSFTPHFSRRPVRSRPNQVKSSFSKTTVCVKCWRLPARHRARNTSFSSSMKSVSTLAHGPI
ncbi:hypothetical protein D3C73_1170850 [compost metagenome]